MAKTPEDKKKLEEVAEAAKPAAAPEYHSKWSEQMDSTLDKILNREKFDYDMNADALYNQYKDRYVQGGQMASQDAMGQAAALTGGYGNSYAQGVAAQAYQNWLSRLNDKVPELQRGAMDRYRMEGDQLLNRYNLYGQREAQDRQRWDADRKNNYQHILSLIQGAGYNPTDEEIAGAGMTRPQVNALLRVVYMQHPELDPNYVAPSTDGGGYYGGGDGSGGGNGGGKGVDDATMRGIRETIYRAGSASAAGKLLNSSVTNNLSTSQQQQVESWLNQWNTPHRGR